MIQAVLCLAIYQTSKARLYPLLLPRRRGLLQGGKRMQVRRFSPELKVKIPGNHPGLFGVLIQLPQARISPEKQEALARRIHGMPLLLDAPLQVEMMYFDAHASI